MKYLRVTMPDGSKWDVPAALIADWRAKYYAAVDAKNGGNYDTSYSAELANTLDDPDLLIDWAENNTNWQAVNHAAIQRVCPSKVDFEEGWVNGAKEVVDL